MGIYVFLYFVKADVRSLTLLVFSLEIYGHIIGMFELNNLYVSVLTLPSLSFGTCIIPFYVLYITYKTFI